MTSTAKRAATLAARNLTPAQIRAIADRCERRTTKPATRKPAPALIAPAMDARQLAMVGKLATQGQMDAINAYHSTLHLRQFDTLAQFRAVVGDMADASVLRASLKAQIR